MITGSMHVGLPSLPAAVIEATSLPCHAFSPKTRVEAACFSSSSVAILPAHTCSVCRTGSSASHLLEAGTVWQPGALELSAELYAQLRNAAPDPADFNEQHFAAQAALPRLRAASRAVRQAAARQVAQDPAFL